MQNFSAGKHIISIPNHKKKKIHGLNTTESKQPDPHNMKNTEYEPQISITAQLFIAVYVTEQIYEPHPLPPLHSLELSFDFLSPDIPAVVVCTLSLDL